MDKLLAGIIIAFSFLGCQAQHDPRAVPYNWPPPDPDSELINTEWFYSEWNHSLLFTCLQTALWSEGEFSYSLQYKYDRALRRGEVPGLGRFTVTENFETLIFPSPYRGYPHEAIFTRVVN